MISQQAKEGLDQIFRNAVASNFVISTDDSCDIESIRDESEIDQQKFAVLTISASAFRILTLFYFSDNDAVHLYFTKAARNQSDSSHSRHFQDTFLEVCNLCCGSFNRQLQNYFPSLGMSTPYVLLHECLTYITVLNLGYIKHFKITLNGGLTLHASLCVSDYGELDFKLDSRQISENTGELELF